MKPRKLKSKILLDSAAASDAEVVIHTLGFLDGQTTNPTLLAKHNDLKYLWPLTSEALWEFYKSETTHIAKIVPGGAVSVEVYADENSLAEDLIKQATEISSWFDNCYVKLPITKSGLEAAQELVKQGVKLNMTLCFSQAQARAVELVAKGAKQNQVVISPFVGRLDDEGEFGLDLVKNILKMYRHTNSPVQVLAASLRTIEQLAGALYLQTDLLTAPRTLLEQWAKTDFMVKECKKNSLKSIEYNQVVLAINDWRKINYRHKLTKKGLTRFASDWQALIK